MAIVKFQRNMKFSQRLCFYDFDSLLFHCTFIRVEKSVLMVHRFVLYPNYFSIPLGALLPIPTLKNMLASVIHLR